MKEVLIISAVFVKGVSKFVDYFIYRYENIQDIEKLFIKAFNISQGYVEDEVMKGKYFCGHFMVNKEKALKKLAFFEPFKEFIQNNQKNCDHFHILYDDFITYAHLYEKYIVNCVKKR